MGMTSVNQFQYDYAQQHDDGFCASQPACACACVRVPGGGAKEIAIICTLYLNTYVCGLCVGGGGIRRVTEPTDVCDMVADRLSNVKQLWVRVRGGGGEEAAVRGGQGKGVVGLVFVDY